MTDESAYFKTLREELNRLNDRSRWDDIDVYDLLSLFDTLVAALERSQSDE